MEKKLLFIPMYNCEKQVVRVLDQLDEKALWYFDELIIVNNRSTDNGEQAVIDYIERHSFDFKINVLRNNQNYGLGGSHKVAFNYAINNNYDYVAVLHGDDQGNLSDLYPIFESGEYRKHDCMLGSRFAKKSKLDGYSKFRTFGNRVYNILFSIFLGTKISDLGSGLNLYNTKMLKERFYLKFPDKLTFNCYMLLASNYFKHDVCFFPIIWKEDDQVSNVKMVSQARNTLGLLLKYFFKREKFLLSELRENQIDEYTATVVYSNRKE